MLHNMCLESRPSSEEPRKPRPLEDPPKASEEVVVAEYMEIMK